MIIDRRSINHFKTKLNNIFRSQFSKNEVQAINKNFLARNRQTTNKNNKISEIERKNCNLKIDRICKIKMWKHIPHTTSNYEVTFYQHLEEIHSQFRLDKPEKSQKQV